MARVKKWKRKDINQDTNTEIEKEITKINNINLSELPSLDRCISNPLMRQYSNLSVLSDLEGAHFVPFGRGHYNIANSPQNRNQNQNITQNINQHNNQQQNKNQHENEPIFVQSKCVKQQLQDKNTANNRPDALLTKSNIVSNSSPNKKKHTPPKKPTRPPIPHYRTRHLLQSLENITGTSISTLESIQQSLESVTSDPSSAVTAHTPVTPVPVAVPIPVDSDISVVNTPPIPNPLPAAITPQQYQQLQQKQNQNQNQAQQRVTQENMENIETITSKDVVSNADIATIETVNHHESGHFLDDYFQKKAVMQQMQHKLAEQQVLNHKLVEQQMYLNSIQNQTRSSTQLGPYLQQMQMPSIPMVSNTITPKRRMTPTTPVTPITPVYSNKMINQPQFGFNSSVYNNNQMYNINMSRVPQNNYNGNNNATILLNNNMRNNVNNNYNHQNMMVHNGIERTPSYEQLMRIQQQQQQIQPLKKIVHSPMCIHSKNNGPQRCVHGLANRNNRQSMPPPQHPNNRNNRAPNEWEICWDFNSKKGCKWGNSCRWKHYYNR